MVFGCSAGSSSSVERVESGSSDATTSNGHVCGCGCVTRSERYYRYGLIWQIRSVLFSVLHQIKDPAPLLPCGSCTLLTNSSSFYQYKFEHELCFAISGDCCRWQAMDVGIR
jgi:hypothetical protein